MILDLVIAPDERLKTRSETLDNFSPDVQSQFDDMLSSMYHYGGIGLAGVQVNIMKRMIVIHIKSSEKCQLPTSPEFQHEGGPFFFANPQIVEMTGEECKFEEGCLSIPGQVWEVKRKSFVTVQYLDYYGKPQILKASGLLARCLLHEIDHIDGILYIDRISNLKRSIALSKAKDAKISLKDNNKKM